jgi:hypothetical protein
MLNVYCQTCFYLKCTEMTESEFTMKWLSLMRNSLNSSHQHLDRNRLISPEFAAPGFISVFIPALKQLFSLKPGLILTTLNYPHVFSSKLCKLSTYYIVIKQQKKQEIKWRVISSGEKMKAIGSSETSFDVQRTEWCSIPNIFKSSTNFCRNVPLC